MSEERHTMSTMGLARHQYTLPRSILTIKRDLLSETARAYAHGQATLDDVEQAAREVERAKLPPKNIRVPR